MRALQGETDSYCEAGRYHRVLRFPLSSRENVRAIIARVRAFVKSARLSEAGPLVFLVDDQPSAIVTLIRQVAIRRINSAHFSSSLRDEGFYYLPAKKGAAGYPCVACTSLVSGYYLMQILGDQVQVAVIDHRNPNNFLKGLGLASSTLKCTVHNTIIVSGNRLEPTALDQHGRIQNPKLLTCHVKSMTNTPRIADEIKRLMAHTVGVSAPKRARAGSGATCSTVGDEVVSVWVAADSTSTARGGSGDGSVHLGLPSPDPGCGVGISWPRPSLPTIPSVSGGTATPAPDGEE